MGVNVIYQRLFRIDLNHDFYSDGRARGLRLLPDPATTKAIKNGQMLFKPLNNGALTFFRAVDDALPPTPLVDLQVAPRFVFGLSVDNLTEFVNITDLDIPAASQKYTGSKIPYYTNDPASPSFAFAGRWSTSTSRPSSSVATPRRMPEYLVVRRAA